MDLNNKNNNFEFNVDDVHQTNSSHPTIRKFLRVQYPAHQFLEDFLKRQQSMKMQKDQKIRAPPQQEEYHPTGQHQKESLHQQNVVKRNRDQ